MIEDTTGLLLRSTGESQVTELSDEISITSSMLPLIFQQETKLWTVQAVPGGKDEAQTLRALSGECYAAGSAQKLHVLLCTLQYTFIMHVAYAQLSPESTVQVLKHPLVHG